MENNNSARYNFFLEGNTDKAVLLIHGITGTPSEMRYLGKKLNKEGLSVYCNTLPRHCSTLNELKKVTWQEIVASCQDDFFKLKNKHSKIFVAGLSMGALVAAHLAVKHPSGICGVIALAPTLFYDGWALHKGKILMHLTWHIPFIRNLINIRESWPYGLKDQELRESIERFYKNADPSKFSNKVFLFGSPFFPMANLYQHFLFTRIVKKEMHDIKLPIIIIHAKEDDMASIKNAYFIYNNIGSKDKRLVLLEDSYHMITIDREKDKVAQEIMNFINKF